MSDDAFTPRPFHPAWWLPGAHAQTIAGRYIRPPHGVHYRRERVETPDGDFLDLDFATVDGAPAAGDDAPLCIAVHGLEGSAQSSYVLETSRALAEHGIRTVAMNFRSCSGEPNRTARFYHAGETGDLGFLLDLLAARFPRATLLGAGFSLGANVLLKYLGEQGEASRIRAATAISIPFDLGRGSDKLAASFMGRVYTRHFVRRLVVQVPAEARRRACGWTAWSWTSGGCAGGARSATSTTRSRRGCTAFADADDYYTRSSSAGYLHGIRVPTLLVHALDDPFVDERAIPHAGDRRQPAPARRLRPRAAGTWGSSRGRRGAPRFWAEREAARFLAGRAERNVREALGKTAVTSSGQ